MFKLTKTRKLLLLLILAIYLPSKHFNVVSTLFLDWYDIATLHIVKWTLKKRYVRQLWNLQRWKTSNQRCLFQCWFEQRYTTSKQRCHFQRRFSQRWATSKQCCESDHLKKIKSKPRVKNKIIFLSFKEYTGLKIFFILFSILRGIYKRIFSEPQISLKHQIYWIAKTIFKPSHVVKCQLVFNFTRRQVQVHYDYRSFNFIFIFKTCYKIVVPPFNSN